MFICPLRKIELPLRQLKEVPPNAAYVSQEGRKLGWIEYYHEKVFALSSCYLEDVTVLDDDIVMITNPLPIIN